MVKGEKCWIRVRGAPNDPESFDLATWNGMVWEIPRINSLGEEIYVQIANYLIIETLPPTAKPYALFRESDPEPAR
ncbi:MAG TPA: hypothetical protein VEZ90_15960 [Blastocatellia bacterium]|nr:hypothetical protein [Blastocatellia bacterium]